MQLSFAIKSSFWSAIFYDVVLILHKWDHCRLYFHFDSHWCSGLHLHWQKHMLFSCNSSLLNRKSRASVSSEMLVRLMTSRTKQDGSLVFFFAICLVLGHQNSCLYSRWLYLTEGNGWEAWQSSLFYVSVCYFEGWPCTKPCKIYKVLIQLWLCNSFIVNEHKTKDVQGQKPSKACLLASSMFVNRPSMLFFSINYGLAFFSWL